MTTPNLCAQYGAQEIPVLLSIEQLETLIAVSRQVGLVFGIAPLVDARFRYILKLGTVDPTADPKNEWVLRSNDLRDVTRFLGLDVGMQEIGYPNATSAPTERQICLEGPAGKRFDILRGTVGLQQRDITLPAAGGKLPLKENGFPDTLSSEFKDRVLIVRMKTRQPTMDCKKALLQAEGDMKRAMEILSAPRMANRLY